MNQVIFRRLASAKDNCFEFEYYKMVGCFVWESKTYFVLENVNTQNIIKIEQKELKRFEQI